MVVNLILPVMTLHGGARRGMTQTARSLTVRLGLMFGGCFGLLVPSWAVKKLQSHSTVPSDRLIDVFRV